GRRESTRTRTTTDNGIRASDRTSEPSAQHAVSGFLAAGWREPRGLAGDVGARGISLIVGDRLSFQESRRDEHLAEPRREQSSLPDLLQAGLRAWHAVHRNAPLAAARRAG